MKRNLKYCPWHCIEVAYFTLVRSTVEYGFAVWESGILTPRRILTSSRESIGELHERWRMTTSTAAMSLPWWSISSGQLLNTDVISSAWPWCSRLFEALWQCHPHNLLLLTIAPEQIISSSTYRNISSNSTPYKFSFFSSYYPVMEQATSRDGQCSNTRLVQESPSLS